MNREYLLDSLDGFKALVVRLLPASVSGSIASVPMTTDGPWTDAEKAVFETAIGIPGDRTFWTPGGFVNVPASNEREARATWVNAVAAIDHPYLFLDPDTGFYTHHNAHSERNVLIDELSTMLRSRKALVVYRHQYWPNAMLDERPAHAYQYVWHGLCMLRNAGLAAFAYQSRAASFFFVSRDPEGIEPFDVGLRLALHGVPAVIQRRLVAAG